MNRCPICGEKLGAIPSVEKNRYAGGCCNPKCPVIFRTKALYNKLEACMYIHELLIKQDKERRR